MDAADEDACSYRVEKEQADPRRLFFKILQPRYCGGKLEKCKRSPGQPRSYSVMRERVTAEVDLRELALSGA